MSRWWVRTLWLLGNRISLSIGFYPMWDLKAIGKAEVRTNGWRPGDRCLDATLRLGKLNLNATVWAMPSFPRLRR